MHSIPPTKVQNRPCDKNQTKHLFYQNIEVQWTDPFELKPMYVPNTQARSVHFLNITQIWANFVLMQQVTNKENNGVIPPRNHVSKHIRLYWKHQMFEIFVFLFYALSLSLRDQLYMWTNEHTNNSTWSPPNISSSIVTISSSAEV